MAFSNIQSWAIPHLQVQRLYLVPPKHISVISLARAMMMIRDTSSRIKGKAGGALQEISEEV
jgi:hypothetical protein